MGTGSVSMKWQGERVQPAPRRFGCCYAYAMVNRQDTPCSPGSRGFGRPPLAAKINFDGTKLPMAASCTRTTTHSVKLSFRLFPISQNRASLPTGKLNQYRIMSESAPRGNPKPQGSGPALDIRQSCVELRRMMHTAVGRMKALNAFRLVFPRPWRTGCLRWY